MKLKFFTHQMLKFKVYMVVEINPLNPELNPSCHLLALVGAHHILHVSRVRVKTVDVWVIIWHNFCRWLSMFWRSLLPPFQVRNSPSLSLQNTDNHYIVFNPWTSYLTINNYLLFCDNAPPCFGPCRPSSGRSNYKGIHL